MCIVGWAKIILYIRTRDPLSCSFLKDMQWNPFTTAFKGWDNIPLGKGKWLT